MCAYRFVVSRSECPMTFCNRKTFPPLPGWATKNQKNSHFGHESRRLPVLVHNELSNVGLVQANRRSDPPDAHVDSFDKH